MIHRTTRVTKEQTNISVINNGNTTVTIPVKLGTMQALGTNRIARLIIPGLRDRYKRIIECLRVSEPFKKPFHDNNHAHNEENRPK
jgi:hypothetical protein